MMLFRFPVFHKILQYWNKHLQVPQHQAEPSTQCSQVSPPDGTRQVSMHCAS